MTRDVACRISSNANCPGPCPTKFRRQDQTPNNPAVTVRRGGTFVINTMANNHRGGFSRWSLVHVRDIYDKNKHRQNAFLYTCSDLQVTKCSPRNNKRDCNYDYQNEYYKHAIKIPKVVPDGVYVLGWVWFGGGWRWGAFGDYYDCMFIRVKGGKLKRKHKPEFRAGPSPTKKNGLCVATVNRVGVCWREPCPGGGMFTKYFKPWEFSDGRKPAPIRKSHYKNPYRIKKKKKGSPYIRSLTIRFADLSTRILASSLKSKFMYMRLTRGMRSTVTCEVQGKVKHVTFYINGREGRTDKDAPYSIAGDWWDFRSRKVKYAPWSFDVDKKYITLSCRATGYDGTEHWRNVELSTY